jgi:hypothetical protein
MERNGKLTIFVLVDNHCYVPFHYKENFALGPWVSRHWWGKKKGTILEHRQQELES